LKKGSHFSETCFKKPPGLITVIWVLGK